MKSKGNGSPSETGTPFNSPLYRSPSHFDDVFLDKSKTVIVHVLAQLNKHGEIPHALALAPKARRERYALLTNQLGESFSLDDQDRGEDLDDGNEERLRRKENRKTIRREMARLSEFTYEQLVECLDPDDKFFKRLTEIIIKVSLVKESCESLFVDVLTSLIIIFTSIYTRKQRLKHTLDYKRRKQRPHRLIETSLPLLRKKQCQKPLRREQGQRWAIAAQCTFCREMKVVLHARVAALLPRPI